LITIPITFYNTKNKTKVKL